MPLFLHVAPESVDGLLQRCSFMELREHDVLLRQGDANHNLYVVLSGELAIRLASQESDPIALLGRGETIGEMSLIDQKGVSAYVIATTDCRLLVFNDESIWALVRFSHAAACNLLSIITTRLRHTNFVLSERMRLDHNFHQYGSVDALTGLHNRYWLDNTLPRLIKRHERGDNPLSLIMTDIDLFKDFNTHYGHLCGDHVIHAVARVLTEHLRPSEMAARYGGDEFIIILPGVALEHARIAAERLRKTVAETVVHIPGGGSVPTPTISIGIAQYRQGDSADDFIAAADTAMYRAKGQGRDTVST
ncbi:MAG: GGDEF domain-containing protein [Deltaproteobacteria bacterium]|nr:GGDEF domain-containing protein [Deltaproteobacteria bacterium]